MDPELNFDQLCSLCRELFDKEPAYQATLSKFLGKQIHKPLHHSIRGLQLAAQNGCHICSLLYGQIPSERLEKLRTDSDHENAEISAEVVVEVNKMFFDSPQTGRRCVSWFLIWLDSETRKDVSKPSCPCLYIAPTSISNRIPFTVSITFPPITDPIFTRSGACATKSHASLGQIKEWLHKCFVHHDKCNDRTTAGGSGRMLPSRLLDTGPLTSESLDFIRLVECSDVHAEAQYIALSHCWGGHCDLKLTKLNAAAFACQIEASSLPKTFIDVVVLAKELGIRYLWIDALCILQDSTEDWQLESSRMLEVYAHATLTVAMLP
jgi:Heterokaryon incompatibility protein (HET)